MIENDAKQFWQGASTQSLSSKKTLPRSTSFQHAKPHENPPSSDMVSPAQARQIAEQRDETNSVDRRRRKAFARRKSPHPVRSGPPPKGQMTKEHLVRPSSTLRDGDTPSTDNTSIGVPSGDKYGAVDANQSSTDCASEAKSKMSGTQRKSSTAILRAVPQNDKILKAAHSYITNTAQRERESDPYENVPSLMTNSTCDNDVNEDLLKRFEEAFYITLSNNPGILPGDPTVLDSIKEALFSFTKEKSIVQAEMRQQLEKVKADKERIETNLRREMGEVVMKRSELTQQMDDAAKERDELQSHLGYLQNSRKELEDALESEMAMVEKDRDSLQKVIQERQKLQKEKVENKHLESKIEKMTAAVSKERNALQSEVRDLKDFEAHLKQLKKENERSMEELEEERTKIIEITGKLQHKKTALLESKAEMESMMQAELNEIKDQIEQSKVMHSNEIEGMVKSKVKSFLQFRRNPAPPDGYINGPDDNDSLLDMDVETVIQTRVESEVQRHLHKAVESMRTQEFTHEQDQRAEVEREASEQRAEVEFLRKEMEEAQKRAKEEAQKRIELEAERAAELETLRRQKDDADERAALEAERVRLEAEKAELELERRANDKEDDDFEERVETEIRRQQLRFKSIEPRDDKSFRESVEAEVQRRTGVDQHESTHRQQALHRGASVDQHESTYRQQTSKAARVGGILRKHDSYDDSYKERNEREIGRRTRTPEPTRNNREGAPNRWNGRRETFDDEDEEYEGSVGTRQQPRPESQHSFSSVSVRSPAHKEPPGSRFKAQSFDVESESHLTRSHLAQSFGSNTRRSKSTQKRRDTEDDDEAYRKRLSKTSIISPRYKLHREGYQSDKDTRRTSAPPSVPPRRPSSPPGRSGGGQRSKYYF